MNKYNILIKKASDDDFEEIRKNIKAEDILNLINEFKHNIIIRKAIPHYEPNVDYTIVIYDDYLE